MRSVRTQTDALTRPSQPSAAGHGFRSPTQSRGNGARQDGLDVARPAPLQNDQNDDAVRDAEAGFALESVYRRHGARVSRWAARLAGPGFDVEDIVHDVFLVVQRRLREFRGDAQVSTWLYEITVRVVQAHRRSRRRRRWLWPFRKDKNSADSRAEIVDDRMSPLDALEQRQSTELLYRFLENLDEKHRTAVVLFELEGMACRDIATITGTSVSNVWARVSRGRDKLIQAFAAWEANGPS